MKMLKKFYLNQEVTLQCTAIHCLYSKTSECKELLKRSTMSDKDNSCAFNEDQSIIHYICVLDQEHRWCVQRYVTRFQIMTVSGMENMLFNC